MQRRDFLVDTLLRAGFRTALRGFEQFCACVELYSDNRNATVDAVYVAVGKAFGCSPGAVEKNLRRLFASSDACAALSGIFGVRFCDVGNKEIIALFSNYLYLHRAEYEKSNAV